MEIHKKEKIGLIVPIGDTVALANVFSDIIGEKAVLRPFLEKMEEKEAYTEAYKRTWEQCVF